MNEAIEPRIVDALIAFDQKRRDRGEISNPLPTRAVKPAKFNSMARLATIPNGRFNLADERAGRISIWLPHLPDELTLAREASFDNHGAQLVMPDGLWLYKSTAPLEINVAFKLHAFNPLCVEGPKTLLDIAAQLHSLVLPASNDTVFNQQGRSAPGGSMGFGSVSQEAVEVGYGQTFDAGAFNTASRNPAEFKFPPACSLRLLQAGDRGLGVNCIGFVKSVSVQLHGPYLQTVNSRAGYNLPSAITANFVFVHNPSYTNALLGGTSRRLVNAYGPDVFEYFYNTAHLAQLANNRYLDQEELQQNRIHSSDAFVNTAVVEDPGQP